MWAARSKEAGCSTSSSSLPVGWNGGEMLQMRTSWGIAEPQGRKVHLKRNSTPWKLDLTLKKNKEKRSLGSWRTPWNRVSVLPYLAYNLCIPPLKVSMLLFCLRHCALRWLSRSNSGYALITNGVFKFPHTLFSHWTKGLCDTAHVRMKKKNEFSNTFIQGGTWGSTSHHGYFQLIMCPCHLYQFSFLFIFPGVC